MSPSQPGSPLTSTYPPDDHSAARLTGWLSGFWLVLSLLLAGCGPAETELYRPPTLVAAVHSPIPPTLTPAPSLQAALETPLATAAPACSNNLVFRQDLTLPDGTVVTPNQELDKRWQVENAGTCNWDAGYRLRLLSGPPLGAAEEQALYPARAGTLVEVRLLFTAPAEAGTYQSAWQAIDPQGNPFGDPIYVQIMVQPAPFVPFVLILSQCLPSPPSSFGANN